MAAPDPPALAGAGSGVELVIDPHVLAAIVLLAVACIVLLFMTIIPIEPKRGPK